MEHQEVVLQPLSAFEREDDIGMESLFAPLTRKSTVDNPIVRNSVFRYGSGSPGSLGNLEEPFDLRIANPRALDLRRAWRARGERVPVGVSASLGRDRPIVVIHEVTPFPRDGEACPGIFALGYEVNLLAGDATCVSVAPSDQRLDVAQAVQTASIGLSGEIALGNPVTDRELNQTGDLGVAGGVAASLVQSFALDLRLSLSFRKAIGAPVGSGGAKWVLYRQDEGLSRPHTLIQTLLVNPDIIELRAVVRTWIATRHLLGRRTWPYPDYEVVIPLD